MHGTRRAQNSFPGQRVIAWIAAATGRQPMGQAMLGTVLIVILILALLGAFPRWGYSRGWGYGPSGIVGVLLIVVLVLALTGRM